MQVVIDETLLLGRLIRIRLLLALHMSLANKFIPWPITRSGWLN